MIKYIKVLLLLIPLISCNNHTEEVKPIKEPHPVEQTINDNKYDFDSKLMGLDSPEEIAKQVISFLRTNDTTRYLNIVIPLEAQKYLSEENFEYRPDITDKEEYIDWLESKYEKRTNNFLVRANYLTQIMIDKKFDITKAAIDTITSRPVRIKNYGGFDRYIVGEWNEITVKMNYKGDSYFLEIPQIIKLKEKWFLYYPEYYLRTEEELEFIQNRIKEINKKADEFWL